MKKKFNLLLLLLLAFSIILSACGGASNSAKDAEEEQADDTSYPAVEPSDTEVSISGVVKIVCPYGVGGTADIIARRFGQVAGELFPDINFIVEQKTGGDGFVGASYFERIDPSEQELFILGYGNAYRSALGNKYGTEEVPYDLDNFKALASIDDRTWIMYAKPGVELEDVLEKAVAGTLKMSGGAALSDPHLVTGALLALEGGTVTPVSYEGGAAQKQALTNGEVDIFVGTTQAGMEDVEVGDIVPILAYSDDSCETFVGPDGPISVPGLTNDRHKALDPDKDYQTSILPAGGFIAAHAKADSQFADDMVKIAKEVWQQDKYAKWMESIGLNDFEVYGDDAQEYLNEAIEKAIEAYELINK